MPVWHQKPNPHKRAPMYQSSLIGHTEGDSGQTADNWGVNATIPNEGREGGRWKKGERPPVPKWEIWAPKWASHSESKPSGVVT